MCSGYNSKELINDGLRRNILLPEQMVLKYRIILDNRLEISR